MGSVRKFFDFLSKECEERGASVVYATHIFDQADSWASHITFMQLNKVLSPIHCLDTYAPYQEILARSGKDRSFCPMYTLVLEDLERQYRAHSDLFTDDNQCLTDLIMVQQEQEQEGDHHEFCRDKDQSGWVSGRVARDMAIQSMEEIRDQRMKDNGIINE